MNPLPHIEPLPPIQPLGVISVSRYLPVETEELRKLGVWVVHMAYNGRFGYRQIGSVTYDHLDNIQHRVMPGDAVTENVTVFLRELLELRFPGWETAEGAFGHFEWYIDDDVLVQQHSLRVMDSRTITLSNE